MKLHLITNELRLAWLEMRQYWFETATAMIFILVMFLALFYGIKGFVLEGDGAQTLDGLVFGFLLWTFASGAYGSITKSIVEDTQRGYIEHLFLCPEGVVRLLLCRAFADILVTLVMLTVVTYLVMWLTGSWLSINLFQFYAVLMLAAPSLVGLGLIIAGFALVFKKVETIGAFLSIGLMGLVALDGLPLNPVTFLPFVPGASLARDWVLNGQPLDYISLLIVALNSAIYLAMGIKIFAVGEKAAKQRNLIGQY